MILLCFAPASGSAGEIVNHGYPTELASLKAGLLLCETLAGVEETFANWKHSFDRRQPEQVSTMCGRAASDFLASIEYVGPFENEHWSADLLRYYPLKSAAHGMLAFDRVYYGYGSAVMKPGVLLELPKPETH